MNTFNQFLQAKEKEFINMLDTEKDMEGELAAYKLALAINNQYKELKVTKEFLTNTLKLYKDVLKNIGSSGSLTYINYIQSFNRGLNNILNYLN